MRVPKIYAAAARIKSARKAVLEAMDVHRTNCVCDFCVARRVLVDELIAAVQAEQQRNPQ